MVRDYADLPPIDAYAGELNQVWTNLIDNAVDAMEGAGTLTVRTRSRGRPVVVEIADTGSGHATGGHRSRVRAVLHDQGRRQGHRARPRHRPPDRGRAPRRPIDIDSPGPEGKGTVIRVSLPVKARS